MLCNTYHFKILNLDSDNVLKFMVFGPNIPKYPKIDPHVHDEHLKTEALAPTVQIFNQR